MGKYMIYDMQSGRPCPHDGPFDTIEEAKEAIKVLLTPIPDWAYSVGKV